jgi:chromosomal replication initiator protein
MGRSYDRDPVSAPPSSPEIAELWGRVDRLLEASVPASTYALWLAPLRAVGAQGSTLLLDGPIRVRDWVARRYSAPIEQALRRETDELSSIAFIGGAEAAGEPGPGAARVPRSIPVDPKHTFDHFVIGDSNRLAHASALAVAELPGEAYNPLFLHGPPGLGKSHLLGAIADYIRRHHPGLNLHLTTAERFTNEFVTALRHSGPEVFKARYRELDALLIDDVQFLEGKERTEEEFVHTFNALHGAGKQIVLSSDRPPVALSRLAERLRSRFDWGLTVELGAPDLRTRMALLWRLASDSRVERPDPQAVREIAERIPSNVRLLEGAMTRVLALSSLLAEPLAPPIVRRALGESPRPSPGALTAPPTLEAIQDAVCAVQGITREEMGSALRSPRIARARQIAMYLARELTGLSLTQIARGVGRDHTTVMHGVRAVQGRLQPGSETEAAIHKVRLRLGSAGEGEAVSSLPAPNHSHP